MGQLVNSMVRGFGFTLGRKAADVVTSTNKRQSVKPVSFSKKQLELIQTYEGIIDELNDVYETIETKYNNGSITKVEYTTLLLQLKNQLDETELELEKVKSVKPSSSIIGKIILIIIAIYSVLWIIKLL